MGHDYQPGIQQVQGRLRIGGSLPIAIYPEDNFFCGLWTTA